MGYNSALAAKHRCGLVLQLFLGLINPLEKVGRQIADVKIAKMSAEGESDKLIHDEQIAVLEGRRDILLEETKHSSTRWIRPAFAAPFVIYNLKVIVWDKVLGWGVTDPLSQNMWWIEVTIIGFYFLGRPVEKYFRK